MAKAAGGKGRKGGATGGAKPGKVAARARLGEGDRFDTPEKAYAEAERLIAKAQASHATELSVQLRLLER
ncbi:MAG: hypothetical protein AB7O57_18800, partial [Hyphomicrobiaceae bacterium]